METKIKVISHEGGLLFQIGETKFDKLDAYDTFKNEFPPSCKEHSLTIIRNGKEWLKSDIAEVGTHAARMCFVNIETKKLLHLNRYVQCIQDVVHLPEILAYFFNINDELLLEVPDILAWDIAKELKWKWCVKKSTAEFKKDHPKFTTESLENLEEDESAVLWNEYETFQNKRVQELFDTLPTDEILRFI
jgi:hypothetical protein